MTMFRIILWILGLYLFYRFVFNFILPVLRISRQVKQQVDQFHNGAQGQDSQPEKKSKDNPGKVGEYIEFEEVKE